MGSDIEGSDIEAIRAKIAKGDQIVGAKDVQDLLDLVDAQTRDLVRLAAEVDRLREREAALGPLVEAGLVARETCAEADKAFRTFVVPPGPKDEDERIRFFTATQDADRQHVIATIELADHLLSRLEQK